MRDSPGGGWRVWVFGGGTALPSAQRDNTYLALEASGSVWLIDCGGSPYQNMLRARLSPKNLRGVILTHSHTDHIYGLPALLFQLSLGEYQGPLVIYGLDDTLRVARQVVAAFALGRHCASHRWCSVHVGDVDSSLLFDESGVQVWAGRVSHSLPALGVRIEGADGGVLTYSGDTSPCSGLAALARGAHWLLHECTVSEPLFGHSTPEDAAGVAQHAGVHNLGIVHYDPLYVVPEEELVDRVRRLFRGSISVLRDLECIEWAGGRPVASVCP